MAIVETNFKHLPGNKKGVTATPITRFASNVVHVLRKRFSLTRVQAEWLCFRRLSYIEMHHNHNNLDAVASVLFTNWCAGMEQEFELKD